MTSRRIHTTFWRPAAAGEELLYVTRGRFVGSSVACGGSESRLDSPGVQRESYLGPQRATGRPTERPSAGLASRMTLSANLGRYTTQHPKAASTHNGGITACMDKTRGRGEVLPASSIYVMGGSS